MASDGPGSDYQIVFARSARRELENLPRPISLRVLRRIESLALTPRPRGCRKLVGSESLCGDSFEEPDANIAKMLNAIESLTHRQRVIWSRCNLREFNIGYDCGDEPWSFNQGLSNETLGRIAVARATVRWTLYPDRPANKGKSKNRKRPKSQRPTKRKKRG